MESLLWMLDLVAVVYLCYWGLREERRENAAAKSDVSRQDR